MSDLAADRKWFIYTLSDPRDGDVRYVGFTTNVKLRFRSHVSEAKCKSEGPYKRNWVNKLLRNGVRPEMKIIDTGFGSGWQEVEKRWISHYREIGCHLTNATDGGEGANGYKASPESIERRRAARKRMPPPSAATRAKISAFHKGSKRPPLTPEQRARKDAASKARVGIKLSAEARASMSRAQKGLKKKPPTQDMKDAMSMLHPRKNQTHCKFGHAFEGENLYIVIRKDNGREQRKCKACRVLAQRAYWSRKAAA